jgi:predicted Zn-dependent peptidase
LIEAAKAVGKDQPLGTFSQGNLIILSNLTIDDVRAFHKNILATQPVVFFSGEPELLADVDLSAFIQGGLSLQTSAYAFKTASKHASILEREIEQTNLTQLYTTDVLYNEKHYIAMRLMVIMLGQLPNSLLFNEIREKRSLCYSINASSMNFDGIMSIQTGIAYENLDEVKLLINTQISRLINGEFPVKLLTIAQKMMRSSMESIADDRSAYLNFLFQRILTDHELDTTDILQRIKLVTKSDIQAAAKNLTMVSEIVLKGTR